MKIIKSFFGAQMGKQRMGLRNHNFSSAPALYDYLRYAQYSLIQFLEINQLIDHLKVPEVVRPLKDCMECWVQRVFSLKRIK